MKQFIFYGNEKESLTQKMLMFKRINSLTNRECENYGFRRCKDGKFVYIYNSKKKLNCETIIYDDLTKTNQYLAVGYCEFKYDSKKKNLHIEYIETYKEYRGNGIGDAMLDYIKNMAVKMGAQTITLDRLCTFTDGETTVAFYNDKETNKALKTLKQSGKPIVDKNLMFYKKHGFVKQSPKEREPLYDYLVSMKLKPIKPVKAEITGITKIFHLKPYVPKNTKLVRNSKIFSNNSHVKFERKDLITLKKQNKII